MLVSTLLIVSIFSTIGLSIQNDEMTMKDMQHDYHQLISQEAEVDVVINQAAGFVGYTVDIINEGDSVLTDVSYKMRTKAAISGTGILIKEIIQQGSVDLINPGETETITFRPLDSQRKSPIGFGNLYMYVEVLYDNITVHHQQRSMVLFFFIFGFKDTYIDISPDVAYEMFLAEEFDLIIDVVGLDIYQLGHLPGAVNYVWANGELEQMIPTLDVDKTYLVYCHTDPPSTSGAQALVNAGIMKTYRLEGNYGAWVDAGYPIET